MDCRINRQSIYKHRKYKPLKGSSYIELYFTILPELRSTAKELINLQNKDNECFRWCHIQKDPQRIKKCDKEYIKKLDYTNVTFPVTQKDY